MKVSDENRRLERLLKVKEAQICESEIKAKDLSLRAEEFEILFNGQLSSVKALQADLTVASNENRALVKEMEMLNHMFNAMERQYVSQAASTSSASEAYKTSMATRVRNESHDFLCKAGSMRKRGCTQANLNFCCQARVIF